MDNRTGIKSIVYIKSFINKEILKEKKKLNSSKKLREKSFCVVSCDILKISGKKEREVGADYEILWRITFN